jgi:Transposase domain (DUF772)
VRDVDPSRLRGRGPGVDRAGGAGQQPGRDDGDVGAGPLDGLWEDEDVAGWYPRDGRPGISPAQLATVSVLQFLLDLSDRDAAEAVRCRIDFKYALGLDLDDPGFHFSVLGRFPGPAAEGRPGRPAS